MLATLIQTVQSYLPGHRHVPPRSWIDEIVLSALLILLLIFWYQLTLTVSRVRYQFNDGFTLDGELPLSFESQDPGVTLTVTFHVHGGALLRPSTYTIRADDCLSKLTINSQVLDDRFFSPCDIDRSKELRLGKFIKAGDNTIVAVVPDSGGRQGISFESSKYDPLVLIVRILIIATMALIGALIAWRTESKTRRMFFLIVVLGVLLRLLYFDATEFNVRANDADGHLDYIHEVSKHWRVPALHGGWEFYQPPLYYFVAAVPYAVFQSLGFPTAVILRLIQGLSVLFSLGILGISAWMADRLFSDRQNIERLLWIATFAVFPGLLLLAPKINNDVLVQLLCFAAAALTIQFWQTASTRWWYALLVTVSLGILTKVNAVPLLGVAFLTLCVHPQIEWRRKLTLGLVGTLLILALNEWLIVWRILEDTQAGIVGNVGNLHGGLLVANSLRDYVTFNPLGILQYPFNNAWEDITRREFFFEYFFRSAFFGEYDGGPTLRHFAQMVLTSGFVCGILAIGGMVMGRVQEWTRALPLWFIFFLVLFTHILFRIQYPYAPSQDFRYSAVVLIPVAYFIILVPGKLPSRLRMCAYGLIVMTLIFCVVYTVAISVINPH